MDEKEAAKPGRGLVIFRYIITIPMLAMVGMVFTNAVLRYGFRSGVPEFEELSRYLFIWLCFLGTIAAFKDKQHVGVDLLITYLRGRPRAIVVAVGDGLILFTFAIMAIGGFLFTQTGGATPGPATDIPFGFMSVSVIVAAVAMGAIQLKDMHRRYFKNGGGC